MYHYKGYESSTLFGSSYVFPKRGDGLPMHDHDEKWYHNVIVTRGSCEIYGPEKKWFFILKSGDVFEPRKEHHPHEIVALEPNTRLLNLFVHGQQDYYEHFPRPEGPDEATIHDPVTIPLP